MNYRDFGYTSFLTKTVQSVITTQSGLEARSRTPLGALKSSNISTPLSATTDIEFTPSGDDAVLWTSGILYFNNGQISKEIQAGTTGTMAGVTYIYYDQDHPTELQSTDVAARATGVRKLLAAVAEPDPDGVQAIINPFITSRMYFSAVQIGDASINSAKIQTISADKITTGTLAANQSIKIVDADTSDTVILIGYQDGGF